ncbi:MAG: hypothetical protein LBU32_09555 [Clostridiales bacterium]|nr:hypothetical protein [Clostridiales bacterium]
MNFKKVGYALSNSMIPHLLWISMAVSVAFHFTMNQEISHNACILALAEFTRKAME